MAAPSQLGSAAIASAGGSGSALWIRPPFVFLDETGATTNIARRHGWSPRGEGLIDAAPFGHWPTTTFTAGLRSTGIIALALSLGDVVVLDNLPAHKVADIREAIAAVGASILYLPLYSPDLIPSPSWGECRVGGSLQRAGAAEGREPAGRSTQGRRFFVGNSVKRDLLK